MSFEQQVEAVRVIAGLNKLEIKTEAGCRFLYLPQFFKTKSGEFVDCLFACDNHHGYPNRLWFEKDLSNEIKQNWNHRNVYINGRMWSAFSMRGKGVTLSEIFLSHLAGAR